MRIALFSDMHGNAVGFEAVLADLGREHYDQLVCLGDVAQGGPQPVEVVDRLQELDCPCVFGNSDEFLLTLDFGSEEYDEAELERVTTTGRWSQEELGSARLDFLRSFVPNVELDLDGRRLICCHATPASNEDVILPETPRDEVARALGSADVVACGHVHLQWLRPLGDRLWFSVGSAGLVYEHKEPLDEQPFEPRAEYAVLTTDSGRLGLEFRRVPFDVDALLSAVRESGMPDGDRYASQWKRR